jgi:hypothetical protein
MPQDWPRQSRHRIHARKHWAIFGLAVVALAVAFGIHINGNSEGSDDQISSRPTVAIVAAENSREIELANIDCLSTVRDRAVIFEQSHLDDPAVLSLIKEQFPGKRIAIDSADCPFGIGFTIIKTVTKAVRYHGRPAEILMAFYVCTRQPSGQFNDRPCTSKNIYLFTSSAAPIQSFSLGLQAFFQNQETEWAVMNLSPTAKSQR